MGDTQRAGAGSDRIGYCDAVWAGSDCQAVTELNAIFGTGFGELDLSVSGCSGTGSAAKSAEAGEAVAAAIRSIAKQPRNVFFAFERVMVVLVGVGRFGSQRRLLSTASPTPARPTRKALNEFLEKWRTAEKRRETPLLTGHRHTQVVQKHLAGPRRDQGQPDGNNGDLSGPRHRLPRSRCRTGSSRKRHLATPALPDHLSPTRSHQVPTPPGRGGCITYSAIHISSLLVRRIIVLSTIAGEAMKPSPRLVLATSLYSIPGLIVRISPSVLKKYR